MRGVGVRKTRSIRGQEEEKGTHDEVSVDVLDGDAVLLDLGAERVREGGEECLGAGVRREHRRGDRAGEGADVEDETAFPR